jgi:hypothetical protein
MSDFIYIWPDPFSSEWYVALFCLVSCLLNQESIRFMNIMPGNLGQG